MCKRAYSLCRNYLCAPYSGGDNNGVTINLGGFHLKHVRPKRKMVGKGMVGKFSQLTFIQGCIAGCFHTRIHTKIDHSAYCTTLNFFLFLASMSGYNSKKNYQAYFTTIKQNAILPIYFRLR